MSSYQFVSDLHHPLSLSNQNTCRTVLYCTVLYWQTSRALLEVVSVLSSACEALVATGLSGGRIQPTRKTGLGLSYDKVCMCVCMCVGLIEVCVYVCEGVTRVCVCV